MSRMMLVVLALVTAVAFADPPDNRPPDNRPPDNGGSDGPVTISNSGAVDAGATADSSSTASSSGNSVVVNTGGYEGGVDATGGAANATGGSAVAEGGESGNNTLYIEYDAAASTASSYAGYCQTGAGVQTQERGFSVTNSDQFCDHIRAAEEMLKAYDRVMKSCVVECVGICTDTVASVDMTCMDDGKAQYYLDAYHENLSDAHALVQDSQATGLIGRIASQLALPAAFVAALLVLL